MKTATVWDTIAQAAAALNVPKGVISRAKDEGAPGFRGGRIYAAEFEPWFHPWLDELEKANSGGESIDELERQRCREQVRKLKIANDHKDGILMLRSDHDAEMRSLASEVQKVLMAIPDRYATQFSGDPVKNHALLTKAAVDEPLAKLSGVEREEIAPPDLQVPNGAQIIDSQEIPSTYAPGTSAMVNPREGPPMVIPL